MMYDINGNKLSVSGDKKQVSDVLLCNNLISHRGLNTAPENTIPALEEAIAAGYKHLEIDLGWTSDGVCVLLHDATIDRTSDGSGSIASMTFATASQYDFGSWKDEKYAGTKIPTLKEALLLAKANNVAVQLDIADKSKNPSNANLLSMLDDIIDCDMMPFVNICCYPDRAQKIVSLCPGVNLTIGLDKYTIEQAEEMIKGCNFVCLSRQYSSYNDSLAVEAHKRGWNMQIWTVNDANIANEKFSAGVDWIITDNIMPNVARHEHENKDVLDRIGKGNHGNLTLKTDTGSEAIHWCAHNGMVVDSIEPDENGDLTVAMRISPNTAIPPVTKTIKQHFKTSELKNDSGFITAGDLPDYPENDNVPTKVSQLENDENFIRADEVFDYTEQAQFTNVIEDKTFVVGKTLGGSSNDYIDYGTGTSSACEEYIPVSVGDTIRMKNFCLRSGKAMSKIAFYNADYGYEVECTAAKSSGYYYDLEKDESGNVISITLNKPSTIAYMRISAYTEDLSENSIVTINEEIIFVMGYGNKLNGKIKVDQSQILNAPQKNCWSILPNEHLNIAYSQILRRKPINTVEHFVDMCENFNFNVLKTDVEPTSDGELVCCHDKGFTFDDNGNVTIYNAENSTLIHDVTAEMCISYTHPTGEHICLVGDYLKVCRKYGKVAFITIRERYMDVVIPKLLSELKKHNMLYSTIINSMTYSSLVEWRNCDTSVMINYTLGSSQNITQETIDKAVELGYCSHCGFGFNGTTSTPNMDCDFEYAREKGVRLLQAIAYVEGSVENAYELGYDGCQISYEWGLKNS